MDECEFVVIDVNDLLFETLPVFVTETDDVLLLDTLAENVADTVGVFVSVLLPVLVRDIIVVLEIVELTEILLVKLGCNEGDGDTLVLADSVFVCAAEIDDEEELLTQPEGLDEADILAESVNVKLCNDEPLF